MVEHVVARHDDEKKIAVANTKSGFIMLAGVPMGPWKSRLDVRSKPWPPRVHGFLLLYDRTVQLRAVRRS